MTVASRPSSNATMPSLVALDCEFACERASALGRLGRRLEATLTALSEHDRAHAKRGAARARLLQQASEALWCFIVQREACGLRDPRPVIRDYGVPADVYAGMGVFWRR